MGVVSEVITGFARRRIFGYTFMVYALVAIAVIRFVVWGHHMSTSGMPPSVAVPFRRLDAAAPLVRLTAACRPFWSAILFVPALADVPSRLRAS